MPDRPLPELTPEMLLSYGGMRELEGARAMQTRPAARQIEMAIDVDTTDIVDQIELAAQDEDYISFEPLPLDEEMPVRTPARSGRFNVLRPPQHEPFRPPAPQPGPQGGPMREVGRVGRFAILAEQGGGGLEESFPLRPVLRMPPMESIQSRRAALQQQAREMSEKSREQVIAHRAAVHEKLPTAYDRLMGEDPFEDDLE